MKTLLYTLILFTGFGSCRQLEKMMERGEYNNAIIYATEKLAGKKKKKTEHVQALEEAFYKLTQRDLEHIDYLNAANNPENWREIADLADVMHYRQERIAPFLPLISKDGYEASFDMVDTYKIKTEAEAGAAEHYYRNGVETLELAKAENDVYLARDAYSLLLKISKYKTGYKDSNLLIREARELGITNILVNIVNEIPTLIPTHTEEELHLLDLNRANNTWRRFHLRETPGYVMDYVALLELNHLDVGPEKERISRHTEEARIKDGWEFVKDNRGREIIDSSGNKVKVDKFKTVRAEVKEVYRKKWALVAGKMKLINTNTDDLVSLKHLEVEAVFEDVTTSFKGDKRAINKKDYARLKRHPEPFPADLAMIEDATYLLKDDFVSALCDLRI